MALNVQSDSRGNRTQWNGTQPPTRWSILQLFAIRPSKYFVQQLLQMSALSCKTDSTRLKLCSGSPPWAPFSNLTLRECATFTTHRGKTVSICAQHAAQCFKSPLPSVPTTASSYLLIIPLICESFSTCCSRSFLSLSSSRFWYWRRILLVCCSCTRSLRSYSSSFLWDIIRRSFREVISSSYSRTWGGGTQTGPVALVSRFLTDHLAKHLINRWCGSSWKSSPKHPPNTIYGGWFLLKTFALISVVNNTSKSQQIVRKIKILPKWLKFYNFSFNLKLRWKTAGDMHWSIRWWPFRPVVI